ncbi:MAG: HD superfamily phosphohydrolase, partial [Sediminicola sp.]
MNQHHKLKIVNDPIYGFITVPSKLIFELIEHPYFQRLRRISQMGMSYLVYPGAHHTRFHHALGAMHLMQKAVQVLRLKGVAISKDEEEALYIAILLHDIGHGPFSHAMEHSIVNNLSHEHLSLLFMEQLNRQFNNRLTFAIQIFKNEYHRDFLHQLISSQLDMDRLDYLRRDSFYTGVPEGAVNSERLITMLNVVDDKLVVEEKAIYSVEKFIVARRLMYWQVYLHKTSLVAEQLLVRVLKRAKELTLQGSELPASDSLLFFLKNAVSIDSFSEDMLRTFAELDDYDIVSALKSWVKVDDYVLQNLSKMILNRDLLKIKLKKKPVSQRRIKKER